MGTAPPSKFEQPRSSTTSSFGGTRSRRALDPFQKDGRRGENNSSKNGGGCVRLSAMPKLPFKKMMLQRQQQQNKKVSMTVLMRLILLKDWQRVLIRCSLFPNEIEDLCTIPLHPPTESSNIHGSTTSSSNVLWIQVLPIHAACALQPPDKVITELLRHPANSPSTTKKNAVDTKIKDEKDGTKGLSTIPLAGIPIETLVSDSKIEDEEKARRHKGDIRQQRHQRRGKWNVSSKSHYPGLHAKIKGGSYCSKDGYEATDKCEQRHDEDEQGCRLLDDNACHNEHFERERERSTMIHDVAAVEVERQLATNGRTSNKGRKKKNFSERKTMNNTSALLTRKNRHQRHQRQPRRMAGDRSRGVDDSSHGASRGNLDAEYGGLSCQLSLEESIGDVETDDERLSVDLVPGAIQDRKVEREDTTVLVEKDDDGFERFHQDEHHNDTDLPIDGWSCNSSIQFVDDEETDDDGEAPARNSSGCADDDRYEYYDAYQDYDDVDVHDNSQHGREQDPDDALLNQFLDEQGIILQLTPGGEIQPMPMQESRRRTTTKDTNSNPEPELESVNENESVFFSLSSPSGSGSDLQVLSSYSDSEKTTCLTIEPLDLWKSLKLGEDRVLPIHIACFYNASLEILKILISNFPDGVLVNVLGMLPIHMVTCNISFPTFPLSTNSSGGSSDIYSLLQEQVDSSQDSANSGSTIMMDGTVMNRSDVLIGRVQVLLQHSPETLFAKSVAHIMRPLEYSKHFANAQDKDPHTNKAFEALVAFLEDEEDSRLLKFNPSEKNTRNSGPDSQKLKTDPNVSLSSRTHSSSTCSTVASSSVGALRVNGRDGHLHLSSSSSSSCLSSPGHSLSDLLQSAQWSEAMNLIQNDYRLARKWTYGIDHFGSKDHKSGCTLWKRLPLHIACSSASSVETEEAPPPIQLIDLLIKSYRGGASCVDPHSGFTPLHLACRRRANNCKSNNSLAMIRSLLQAAPNTTKVMDLMDGQLPLHHAILAHAPYSVIETLVYHDPSTVSCPDNNGKTPLWLAQRVYHTTTPTTTTNSTRSRQTNHPVLTLLELAWI